MKTLGKLTVAGLVVFAALQFVRPAIPTEPATAEVQVPPEVGRAFSTVRVIAATRTNAASLGLTRSCLPIGGCARTSWPRAPA